MKTWPRYLRFLRADIRGDVDDELNFHLEARIKEYERSGMTRSDAERVARERLGDLTALARQLEAHDRGKARRLNWRERVDRFASDVKITVRGLRRSPGFMASVCAVLGIGIGMATAMYVVITTVLVNPLPVVAQDRVVIMHPLDRSGTHLDAPFAYLATIARDSGVFRGAAGVYHQGALPEPFLDNGTPINLSAADASANYFAVLGMRAEIGRLFVAADGDRGASPVIVLAHTAWERQFGGDRDVVGRTLIMPYTQQGARIVGVAPPGFRYPDGTDAWVPMLNNDPAVQELQVDVIARLAPGVTLDAARAGLFALTQRINPFHDATTPVIPVYGVDAQSLPDVLLGRTRPALVALMLAVGLLLLIACVNVGSLLLVRFLARRREIAVRRAIGASHGDVTRLFLIETGVLALAGGILGCLLATASLRLISLAAPPELPRVDALGRTGVPLGAALAITIVAALLFGVLPSTLASRVSSYAVLRADVRAGAAGRAKRRVRHWLVATQMALAVVLLSGASLLVRSLARLESQDLGYRPDHLSILSFMGPKSDLSDNARLLAVAQRLVARIEATPGVLAATPVEQGPFKGQSLFIMKLLPDTVPTSDREHAPYVPFEFVGPDYFRTLGIPILQGRSLLRSDTRAAPNVVVISESMAKRMWPGQRAVGKRLVNGETTWTVVGVARDTHFRDLQQAGPLAYFNWDQVTPFWNGYIAIRTTGPLGTALPAIRVAMHDVDPRLLLYDARTMDSLLDGPLGEPRLSALLLASFSLVALLLSAIGLYGVMSATVRQQTRDIGVRLALGAAARDVRRLVLGDALVVIAAGAAAGLVVAGFAGHLLVSQLFGVSPLDPLSLTAAAALLVAIGLAAAYWPARRATRIDPVQALRAD